MARPQTISDQIIIEKAYDLLMKDGPHGLTFEKLASQVGLVPAALVRRFKNKKELLLQIDRYALKMTNQKVEEAIKNASSPVEAIIAQFVSELAFASSIERFVNGQEYLLMDLGDETLYNNYLLSYEHRHRQIVDLLQRAIANDELIIRDVSLVARHLEMIAHGSGHVWAMTQQDTIETYIREHILLALEPYRVRKDFTM